MKTCPTGRAKRPISLSRRQFLGRCGALGAAVMVAQLPVGSLARAGTHGQLGAEAALRLLALDTVSGLVVFVVPGPDPYSQAQGLTHGRPGGIDARAAEGIVELFDEFLPLPDSFVQAMAAGFAEGMSDVPMPMLDPLLRSSEESATSVDRALQAFTANDETAPLSLLVALMLNFVATSVNPAAVSGPFPSAPFANLQFAEKAEVFRRIEEDNAELVALLDRNVSEPMNGSLSGQIRFLGGALTAAATLFSYSEWGVLDKERGVATARPVGWDLTGYARGRTTPADGWEEFRGYYQGHRRAETTARWQRSTRGRSSDA